MILSTSRRTHPPLGASPAPAEAVYSRSRSETETGDFALSQPVLAALFAMLAAPALAAAPDARITAELMKLSPEARREQRCDGRAMGQVSRDHAGMQPDSIIAYAYSDPKASGTKVTAPGAAIHIGGAWYHISYSCQTSDDGLDIRSFSYTLGKPIPKDQWADHQLVE
jgi:hypothetical protein